MAGTMPEMKTLTIGPTTYEVVDEKARSEIAEKPSASNIPAKVSDLVNDMGYQTADNLQSAINSALASVYTVKGSCTYDGLPSAGSKVGDVWNVTDKGGMNYVWDGSTWDELGNMTVADWDSIIGKPATFPPSSHMHTPASIGAATASHTHTLDDLGAAAADHTHAVATSSASGFMSAEDKARLDGLFSFDEATGTLTINW